MRYGYGASVAFQAAGSTNFMAGYYSDVLKFKDDEGHKKAMQLTVKRRSKDQYDITARVGRDTILGRVLPPKKEHMATVESADEAAAFVKSTLFGGMEERKGTIVHGKSPLTAAPINWEHISKMALAPKAKTETTIDPQAPQA